MSAVEGAYLCRQGEAETRWLGETSTSFLATGDQTTGAFALVDERAHGGESVPRHRHPEDMESFYVLDGEITFFIGDGPGTRVCAGTFVHIPGGTVHGFRVESGTARYLILTTPRHGEVLQGDHRAVRAGRLEAGHVDRRGPDRQGGRRIRDRVRRAAAGG